MAVPNAFALVLLTSTSVHAFTVPAFMQAESCTPTGTCCGDSCGTCCNPGKHKTGACGLGGGCGVCKDVVNWIVKQGSKKTCAEIDVDGVAICEAIGLGPEDPLADLCAAAVVGLCPTVHARSRRYRVSNARATPVHTAVHECSGDGADWEGCRRGGALLGCQVLWCERLSM